MTGWKGTPGPWALNRMDSAEELARLRGTTLQPHEAFYRTNSGAWIVTFAAKDNESFGGPVAEVTFKGKAKRGEAYSAPDPEGQANAKGIAAVPAMVEALQAVSGFDWRNNRTHLLEMVRDALRLAGVITDCPGHEASDDDAKVCRHCGTHVDSERPGRFDNLIAVGSLDGELS